MDWLLGSQLKWVGFGFVVELIDLHVYHQKFPGDVAMKIHLKSEIDIKHIISDQFNIEHEKPKKNNNMC